MYLFSEADLERFKNRPSIAHDKKKRKTGRKKQTEERAHLTIPEIRREGKRDAHYIDVSYDNVEVPEEALISCLFMTCE